MKFEFGDLNHIFKHFMVGPGYFSSENTAFIWHLAFIIFDNDFVFSEKFCN